MIKLVNVNKYFNRFKSNQIHVINNTTLDLPETGLVALLGESGCGKTTLLNAIGGLDKINSGSIYINGKKMPRGTTYTKDKLRTLNIGYIFQNFNLLDNMTVFDNIAISLKMIGIKNKKEIEKRVYYVLEQTNMYRFRNRLCSDLSGGQRQRVAIARALVKNPSVIIADEPTGNLDSKNTIEVMNIIKHISTSKLVLLVTHEKEIAYFYASRIIKLEDGKIISNEENTDNNELDLRMDNKIYLKDYKIQDTFQKYGYNFNIYTNHEISLDLQIAVKNGNIYIKSNNSNIEVVDDNSNIEFVDDNYKAITKEDYEKNTFDLSKLDNSKHKIRYSSIYSLLGGLILGFKKVKSYTVLKKILLIGFVFSVMFIFYALSNIFGILDIKDSQFVEYNKNYYVISSSKKNVELYEKLKNMESVEYVIPGSSSVNFSFVSELYQYKYNNPIYKASMVAVSTITDKDIITGKLPENSHEIVLDKFIYESYKNSMTSPINQYNILKYEDFVGKQIKLGKETYTIVGVSDQSSPSLYVDSSEFVKILNNNVESESYYDRVDSNQTYKSYIDSGVTVKKGRLPENDYEVMINYSNYNPYDNTYKIDKETNFKINERNLVLVGFYESPRNESTYYVNENMINVLNICKLKDFTIYPKDEKAFVDEIKNMDIKYKKTYDASKESFKKSQLKQTRSSIIIACVLLGISFLEIYLMIRSSFISRIKEVGTMRAIGVKKTDIYKMFSNEIIAISIITSIPGIWLMYNILKSITDLEFFKNNYMLDYKVALLSGLIFLVFNLVVGLLPVKGTIRKSPASILSRNDVD
ncbi:MAG: ABC transporter ATP-binding protein/permease [Bacilli bacterium]|nr:ABC transporter ATP-binding protein/permease [Bacilli bacterium]